MSLTFPTGRNRGNVIPGQPVRASHCTCVGGSLCDHDDEPCLRCGKYRKQTIADTWQQRAQKVADANRAQAARQAARAAKRKDRP